MSRPAAAQPAGRGNAKSLAIGGAAALSIYLFGHGLAFLTQLTLARMLGAGGYGIYAIVMGWVTALVYIAMLGQNIALLRFLPAYVASNDLGHAAGLLRYAERNALKTALGLLVAAGAIVGLLHGVASGMGRAFLVALPAVPIIALTTIYATATRAFGGVVSALVPMRVVRELVLLGLVLVVAAVHSASLDPAMALVASVTGAAMALVVARLAMTRLSPAGLHTARHEYDAGIWRRTALPLMVVTAAEVLFDKMGVLVLGMLGAAADAGILALTFSISMLAVLPRTAIDTFFAPTIASLHARGHAVAVQALATRAAAIGFAAAAFVVAALIALAPALLEWFGPEFTRGVVPLRILLLAQLVAAGAGAQLTIMAMTGGERVAARILIIATAASAVLCMMLAYAFGMIGAAVGMAIAIVGWNGVMALDIWRTLRLWPGITGLLRPA